MTDMSDNSKVTLRDIYEAVDGLRNDIATNYVTKAEFDPIKKTYVSKDAFEPVRNIVYGLVALALIAVAGAIIALVIHSSPSTPTEPHTTVQVNPTDGKQ